MKAKKNTTKARKATKPRYCVVGASPRKLQWQDIDYADNRIHVRRKWKDGVVSEKLKTKKSRSAVPMAPLLAQFLRE